jgi:hypothetical protein
VANELGKKIKGARDDNGALAARERPRPAAGLLWIGEWLDMPEIRFGA